VSPAEGTVAVGAALASTRMAHPRTATDESSRPARSCSICGSSATVLLLDEAFCARHAAATFGPEFFRRYFRAKGVAA
jgi:hypothetical protein